jgi:predicted RNA-binding Zn ribbon-like protein
MATASLGTPAGHPFLGFLNTVTDDGKTRNVNSFRDSEELIAELEKSGLSTRGLRAPGSGQIAHILSLRESAYAVLSAMAAGRTPGREESLHLQTVLKSTLQDADFDFGPAGLRLRDGPLGGLHDRLVLSLWDLLQKADLGRLRECKRCTHLFLDHGRGIGRRWCSMSRCGNRVKAQTFRIRQRALQV